MFKPTKEGYRPVVKLRHPYADDCSLSSCRCCSIPLKEEELKDSRGLCASCRLKTADHDTPVSSSLTDQS